MATPLYAPDLFGFTEIVEINLPHSITGWATATCGGKFPYVPPEGYQIVECEEDIYIGSHGGCPHCIMSLVTCEYTGTIADLDTGAVDDGNTKISTTPVAIGLGLLLVASAYVAYRKVSEKKGQ